MSDIIEHMQSRQARGTIMLLAIDSARRLYTRFGRNEVLVDGMIGDLLLEIANGHHDSQIKSLYAGETPDSSEARYRQLVDAFINLIAEGHLALVNGVYRPVMTFDTRDEVAAQLGMTANGTGDPVNFILPAGVRFTSTHPKIKRGITKGASRIKAHRLEGAMVDYNHGSCRFSPAKIVWPGTGGYWRHGELTTGLLDKLLTQAKNARVAA